MVKSPCFVGFLKWGYPQIIQLWMFHEIDINHPAKKGISIYGKPRFLYDQPYFCFGFWHKPTSTILRRNPPWISMEPISIPTTSPHVQHAQPQPKRCRRQINCQLQAIIASSMLCSWGFTWIKWWTWGCRCRCSWGFWQDTPSTVEEKMCWQANLTITSTRSSYKDL